MRDAEAVSKSTDDWSSTMKVMITGAAGFIGGTLAEYCSAAGCSVLGLGISDPAAAMSWSFEHCDVRDAERLGRLISSFKPDRIFHLAAQSYPTVSLSRPRETMESTRVEP